MVLLGGLMFHIVLSEDLLKSGVHLKGSISYIKENKNTENKMNNKVNPTLNTQDIISKDKVFYFLNATETISSSSSSTESISSSDDTSSIKDSNIDDSKRRPNRLLPINDYNIQNYYNIQNRRYSYDMSYSTPRSNSLFNKNKGFGVGQTPLSPLNNGGGKNIVGVGQDNTFLSPNSYGYNQDIPQHVRQRRYSSQSENNSFDNNRPAIKNTKCNTFPNLIIDSAEDSEEDEDEEDNAHSYSGHTNGNHSQSGHPSRLLLSPYEPRSLSKRRALTMPDLTVGHGRSSNHNLIRVNSTTLTDHNIKPVHPLSKTTYLIMEVFILFYFILFFIYIYLFNY